MYMFLFQSMVKLDEEYKGKQNEIQMLESQVSE